MTKSILIPICILIAVHTNAQSVQIGIGIGSTIITGHELYTNDLSGTVFQEYYNGSYAVNTLNGLGFDSEYHLNIKARLFIKNIPFNLYSDICYSKLTGKGTVYVIPSPISCSIPPPQKSESKCDLINGCLGMEYQILKAGIIPVLSCGIVLSHLGDIRIQTNGDEYVHYDGKVMDGGMRYGFEFGIGCYYEFYNRMLIGISSKYAMNNLFGRKPSEEKINTIKLNIDFFYEL